MTTSTDRIEKHIVLRAPVARVWRALTDRREFGSWFGFDLRDDFVAGKAVHGSPTMDNFKHLEVTMQIERVDREAGVFAFRWHPFAIDDKVDYSAEPMTLVELRVAETAGGTELTVVESGFDALPAHRRATAFDANAGGWTQQLGNIERYLSRAA